MGKLPGGESRGGAGEKLPGERKNWNGRGEEDGGVPVLGSRGAEVTRPRAACLAANPAAARKSRERRALLPRASG